MGMLYRIICIAAVSPMIVGTLASCAARQKPAVDRLATASVPARPASDIAMPLPSNFTIQAAVRRAVDYQPSIVQAAWQVKQQGAAIRDAQSGYYPSIGGGLNLGRDSVLGNGIEPAANLTASQMIYDFGKTSNRVDTQSAVQQTRRAEFLTAVDDVIRTTAEAAIETLRNRSLAVVAADQIRDTKSILALVRARTERGASTKSDQLQAEARVQTAQSTALEISAQSQRWQGTLASLLGGAGKIELSANIPSALPNACSQTEPNWDSVPSVQSAASKKREAEASLRLVRSDALPTLAIQAGGSSNLLDGFARNPTYIVGLQLTGKLYNGGSYGAKRDEGKFAVQAAEAGISTARTDAIRNWRESGSQVSAMGTLLSSLASRQGLMRETRDLYQRQFLDLGTRTLLDVLNADQELHAARFDAINVRFELYKLNIACAYTAGKLRDIFALDKTPGMPSTVLSTANKAEAKIEMAAELPPQPLLPKVVPATLPDPAAKDMSNTASILGDDDPMLVPAVSAQSSAEKNEEAPEVQVPFQNLTLRGSHTVAAIE